MNEFIIGNTYISTNVTEAVERYGKDINKLLFNKYTLIKPNTSNTSSAKHRSHDEELVSRIIINSVPIQLLTFCQQLNPFLLQAEVNNFMYKKTKLRLRKLIAATLIVLTATSILPVELLANQDNTNISIVGN